MLPAFLRRLLTSPVRRSDRRFSARRVFRPRLECLEERAVPAIVTWIHPGDGDWNDGANWSSGSKPGLNDDVVINTPYTITYSSGPLSYVIHSLNESVGANLVFASGSLGFSTTFTINGGMLIDGGSLELTNKTLDGTGTTTVAPDATWLLRHSTIHTNLDNQGILETRSGVDVTSHFSNDSGATLRVVGDGTGTVNFQVLRVANTFTNDGLIETWTTQPYYYASIGVTNGTLINAPDGAIHTVTGAGGGTNLNAQLDNHGTITVDSPLTVSYALSTNYNSGTITLSGSDMSVVAAPSSTMTFTNIGNIAIGAGHTLTVAYGGSTFNQNGGSITGAGTLDLYGLTANFAGAFNTNGLNVLMHFSTYNSPGTLTIANGSTFKVLYNATVNTAIVNDGLIDLSSIAGPNTCDLNVSGLLTNASDGTILSDIGLGGTRTINALVDNEGTITVNLPLAITKTSVAQINNGTINVNAGTVNINLSGVGTYTNNGTIYVAQGSTFAVNGGPLTNFNAGTLTGGTYTLSGTFKFQNAAITTNAAAITLLGPTGKIVNQSNVNALTGLNTNTAAGALNIQAGVSFYVGAFTNAGSLSVDATSLVSVTGTYLQNGGTTILNGGTLKATTNIDIEGGVVEGVGTLDSSVYNGAGQIIVGLIGTPGTLTITGDFVQGAYGDLYVEIGGTNAGTDYGHPVVHGNATLDGTLSVVLINGFTPVSGSSYQVLTANTVTGAFATLDQDGVLFTPAYNSGNVTLIAN